jgi:hypothetical protein
MAQAERKEAEEGQERFMLQITSPNVLKHKGFRHSRGPEGK